MQAVHFQTQGDIACLTWHHLIPVVDRVFAFDHATEAFDYFAHRKHIGKVVITIE